MASRTAYSTWTPQKPTLFDGHYLRNRSNLDIGVLGYIGIVQHKEHSPEVLSVPPGTPCISHVTYIIAHLRQQCRNSKFVVFQEKLLNVLKCCYFQSATTTQLLSSGKFCKLRYDTIPVKSTSANVSFYTNNSNVPNSEL